MFKRINKLFTSSTTDPARKSEREAQKLIQISRETE